MSSIQDIMEPEDVEPLEEQRNRRLRQASLQAAADISTKYSTGPLVSTSSHTKQHSSGIEETMDSYGNYNAGGYGQASGLNRGRQSSRGSESEIRLTPVTGRVSRAKKGQPVHVCDRCTPPRVNFHSPYVCAMADIIKVFTRAEHLRYDSITCIF